LLCKKVIIIKLLSILYNLTNQVERLNIDVHTQALRVDVENIKWQKLSATLKRVKKGAIPTNRILSQLRQDHINTINQLTIMRNS